MICPFLNYVWHSVQQMLLEQKGGQGISCYSHQEAPAEEAEIPGTRLPRVLSTEHSGMDGAAMGAMSPLPQRTACDQGPRPLLNDTLGGGGGVNPPSELWLVGF